MRNNGEQDFINFEMFSDSTADGGPLSDTFFEELLRDAHASMDNQTRFHVQTKLAAGSSGEDMGGTEDTAESNRDNPKAKKNKRPVMNYEAVRRYREKKKARTAHLEDEVVKLRVTNQQLMKEVQGQAVLEAEIERLKCLLVDIRGRIEGEFGFFPYQKSAKNLSH